MKHSVTYLTGIIAVVISTITQAEVYEGKDAEGNPVFSDTPAPGAAEIDLPKSNIADPVEVPAADIQAPGSTGVATDAPSQGGDVIVVPNSRNEALQRKVDADMPQEVLDAEPRYEVGDEVTAEERARREAAREGVVVDEEGNIERIEHRGHAGGSR